MEELKDWEERVEKAVGKTNYITELKIDGLNISLWYEKGLLVRAITRGDGSEGEDVTHTVRTIKNIPLKLFEEVDIEVSGEVYMPAESFANLGGEFMNPRNAPQEVYANDLQLLRKEIYVCFYTRWVRIIC